jgi:hypothetical protein
MRPLAFSCFGLIPLLAAVSITTLVVGPLAPGVVQPDPLLARLLQATDPPPAPSAFDVEPTAEPVPGTPPQAV